MASQQRLPARERRPSTGAPIVNISGGVGPAGISRPKHKRTLTGFGAGEIKHVEGKRVATGEQEHLLTWSRSIHPRASARGVEAKSNLRIRG